MKANARVCVTLWVEEAVKEALEAEARRLGVNRSWVLRRLIDRWMQRRDAASKEASEALEVG
jgi:hypothetical protein